VNIDYLGVEDKQQIVHIFVVANYVVSEKYFIEDRVFEVLDVDFLQERRGWSSHGQTFGLGVFGILEPEVMLLDYLLS
jgi:hypothetical protein